MDSAMKTIRTLAMLLAACLIAVAPPPLTAVPSLSGPTGGLVIPDPMTLEPERTELGVGVSTYDQLSSNLDVATSWDASFKVNVGVYHNLELGLEKTYRQQTNYRDQPFYVQAKMRFPVDTFNVAVGVVGPIQGPDASSFYTVLGWKSLWGGFGVNFGGKEFHELTLTQMTDAGVAKFGGFNLHRTTVAGRTGSFFTGEADTYFGLLGFNYQVSGAMSLLGDYDGDRFSGGFRFKLKELFLDIAYIGQREADSLFNRQSQHVQVNVSYRF
jgi:hypothetical protein